MRTEPAAVIEIAHGSRNIEIVSQESFVAALQYAYERAYEDRDHLTIQYTAGDDDDLHTDVVYLNKSSQVLFRFHGKDTPDPVDKELFKLCQRSIKEMGTVIIPHAVRATDN